MTLRERIKLILAGWHRADPSPALALLGVWFAVGLHLVWSVLLLISPAPERATAVYALSMLFPNRFGLVVILVTVATCALYGLFKQSSGVTDRVLLLAPQQLVLGVSAAGAIGAMVLGHFADGTVKPSAFIIVDQAPAVLALLVHSASIAFLAVVRPWK